MGALAAYLATRLLLDAGVPVRLLCVAGCPAPHLPERRPPKTSLSDDELVEELALGAASTEKPDVVRELLSVMLPTIRADLAAAENYVHVLGSRLPCPIAAFAGEADPEATPSEVAEWREHTNKEFSFTVVPGEHFFIRSAEDEFLGSLLDVVRALTRG